jgi:hypothetical protein
LDIFRVLGNRLEDALYDGRDSYEFTVESGEDVGRDVWGVDDFLLYG